MPELWVENFLSVPNLADAGLDKPERSLKVETATRTVDLLIGKVSREVEKKAPEEFDEIRKRDADEYLRVTLKEGVYDGSFIAEVLVKGGLKLKMLREEEIDLEDVFMGITKGITN